MAQPEHTHHFIAGTDPAKSPLVLLQGSGGNENDLVPLVDELAPGSPGPSLLLRARRPWIEIDAPRGRDGQSGLRGGGHLRMVSAQSHVDPHLLVIDVSAWHRPLRSSEETRPIRPTGEGNASVGEPALVGLKPSRRRLSNRSG